MYSHCSLFIVQLYIHKENSIVITLIILMNALDVITVLAPYIAWLIVCWRRSHAVRVAVAATPGVMLQAVFSLVPSVVLGSRLTSLIGLVGPLPDQSGRPSF